MMYDRTIGKGWKFHTGCTRNIGLCHSCNREFFLFWLGKRDDPFTCDDCIIEQLLWSGYFIPQIVAYKMCQEEYLKLLFGEINGDN